jgi:hypothetical protein
MLFSSISEYPKVPRGTPGRVPRGSPGYYRGATQGTQGYPGAPLGIPGYPRPGYPGVPRSLVPCVECTAPALEFRIKSVGGNELELLLDPERCLTSMCPAPTDRDRLPHEPNISLAYDFKAGLPFPTNRTSSLNTLGVLGRSPTEITQYLPYVRAANIMVSRSALCILFALCLDVHFVLEQPLSSIMPFHPRYSLQVCGTKARIQCTDLRFQTELPVTCWCRFPVWLCDACVCFAISNVIISNMLHMCSKSGPLVY